MSFAKKRPMGVPIMYPRVPMVLAAMIKLTPPARWVKVDAI